MLAPLPRYKLPSMNINESIKPQGVYTLKVSDPQKAPEKYNRILDFVDKNPIERVAPCNRAQHHQLLQALIKDYEREALVREVQFTNLVPTVGRAVLARLLVGDVTYTGEINKVALGDGTVVPANGDTVLDNETYRQDITSAVQVNNIAYLTSFIAAGVGTGSYTEGGLFIDGTGSADTGQLFSRVLFTPTVDKGVLTSLTIDVSVTLT